MKKVFAAFSILALCFAALGCTEGSGNANYEEERPDLKDDNQEELPPVETTDDMIIAMSYNIRTGTSDRGSDNAWDKRKIASPAMIKDVKPTVFGLQEALYFQIEYLKENCPDYDCYGVGRESNKANGASTPAGDEVMAIFYDRNVVTLEDHGTFWLAEGAPTTPTKGWKAKYKRTATWGIFTHKPTGKKFFYMNTHLDYVTKDGENGANETKAKSIILLKNKIRELNPQGYPAVLTGDFNTESTDAIFNTLKQDMKDARTSAPRTDHGGTVNDWGTKNSIIDHIFYSDFKALEYKVVRERYEGVKYISDHYPIYTVLKFI